MISFLVLALGSLLPAFAQNETRFPGLKDILTPEEWRNSGLEQLGDDRVALLNAAIRGWLMEQARLAEARQAVRPPSPAATEARPSSPRTEDTSMSNYGFAGGSRDYRDQPVMEAKVIRWVARNTFLLDNGQIWMSVSSIPFDILGQEVVIEPRRFNRHAIRLKDGRMSVPVARVE